MLHQVLDLAPVWPVVIVQQVKAAPQPSCQPCISKKTGATLGFVKRVNWKKIKDERRGAAKDKRRGIQRIR